jgi:hypothetical protein
MSLIEKLEAEYKRADKFCVENPAHSRYLETCDLRETLKEAIDYIRRPTK